MPVIRKSPPPSPDETRLRAELLAEMHRNSPNGSPGAPTVEVRALPGSKNVHVTVLWDAWDGLPLPKRGEIVLGAYEDAFGTNEMLKVMLALGITSQEASRMNLKVG